MTHLHKILLLFALFTGFTGSTILAAEAVDPLISIQQRWDHSNYNLSGDDQITAFAELISQTETYLADNPKAVNWLIWDGIIKSSLAGAQGGLGALKLVKQAKSDFEQALTIEPAALDGSAYTSLATLYHNVPAWPIGFGSDKKAELMFERALALNPLGIDSNYFYARFLYDNGELEPAMHHLKIAQQARPRPYREVADNGRQIEIRQLIAEIENK